MESMKKACRDSRDINLKIEWGYIPYNALHLLALKTASVCIVIAAFYLGFSGQLDFTYMMFVILLSFHVFGSLEPIADCTHVLAVIDDALEHLDELTKESFIDADGQQIEIAHYDIEFQNVDFSYGEGKERRQVLHNVNLKIPEYLPPNRRDPIFKAKSGRTPSTCCSIELLGSEKSGNSVPGGFPPGFWRRLCVRDTFRCTKRRFRQNGVSDPIPNRTDRIPPGDRRI